MLGISYIRFLYLFTCLPQSKQNMAQKVNVEEIAIITRLFGLEGPQRLIIQFYSLYLLQMNLFDIFPPYLFV